MTLLASCSSLTSPSLRQLCSVDSDSGCHPQPQCPRSPKSHYCCCCCSYPNLVRSQSAVSLLQLISSTVGLPTSSLLTTYLLPAPSLLTTSCLLPAPSLLTTSCLLPASSLLTTSCPFFFLCFCWWHYNF